jgi:glycosyltransferase involved in cell wall biosynthesis
MKSDPLVSICIPAYNASKYIRYTINSLLEQSYHNIEIIIVDDESDDDTFNIIKEFDSSKIKVFSQKNSGAGAARNKAFESSCGSLIKYMDADDLLNRDAIYQQVKLHKQYPNAIISGKWGRFYGPDTSNFTESPESVWKNMSSIEWITDSWRQGPNMTQPGIFLIPRKLIEDSGGWVIELSKGPNDDMEFFTRLILASNQIFFCPESTLFYRSGIVGSLSKKKDKLGLEMAYKTVLMAGYELLKKEDSKKTREAFATQVKSIIFDAYPEHIELYNKAKIELTKLGGSDFEYQTGGITKILSKVFGWRAAKRIKQILGR